MRELPPPDSARVLKRDRLEQAHVPFGASVQDIPPGWAKVAVTMSDYHESWDALPPEARDIHRAVTSLKEELEAVDWYHQRVVMCTDPQLKKILAHNRDEEIEHACMTLEWLRRNMPKWDEVLRTYLFSEGDITELEDAATGSTGEGEGDLGIRRPSR